MEHKKTSNHGTLKRPHLKPWNIKKTSPQTMEHKIKKTSHLKPWNIKRPLTPNHGT
jgi:hypothetical protein